MSHEREPLDPERIEHIRNIRGVMARGVALAWNPVRIYMAREFDDQNALTRGEDRKAIVPDGCTVAHSMQEYTNLWPVNPLVNLEDEPVVNASTQLSCTRRQCAGRAHPCTRANLSLHFTARLAEAEVSCVHNAAVCDRLCFPAGTSSQERAGNVNFIVATPMGCRVFTDSGAAPPELEGRYVYSLSPAAAGGCLAVVDDHEIWRRSGSGAWARVARVDFGVECVLETAGVLYAGSSEGATMHRIDEHGEAYRLLAFDEIPTRPQWFPQGPPLCVRSLDSGIAKDTLLAAVHVGGIQRSPDGGETWRTTLPVDHDVHEVRSHPCGIIAVASAVGLGISTDDGRSWNVLTQGLEILHSLAVGVLEDEVVFSIQESPFAPRSQLWRWRRGETVLKQVREGLPEWLGGKVDTCHLAVRNERAACIDAGGNLWAARTGARDWRCLAQDVDSPLALLMI